jgi:hypothetical protein
MLVNDFEYSLDKFSCVRSLNVKVGKCINSGQVFIESIPRQKYGENSRQDGPRTHSFPDKADETCGGHNPCDDYYVRR